MTFLRGSTQQAQARCTCEANRVEATFFQYQAVQPPAHAHGVLFVAGRCASKELGEAQGYVALCGLTLMSVSLSRVAKVLPYVRGDREEVNELRAFDGNVKNKKVQTNTYPALASQRCVLLHVASRHRGLCLCCTISLKPQVA